MTRTVRRLAIAGGADVADVHFHAGFDAMRAYTTVDNDRPERASRPYAADRAGFVFSEGAGVVVLETRQHAEARGAAILGVLLGYGMSSDGTGNMVAPSPEGAELAMRRALDHAGVAPDAIDYVNTHATSTPLGDVSEVRALRKVLGGRHVAYSSTKGYTGHPVSAAGAIEAIFTLAMLRGGWIAPCVNAEPLDQSCSTTRRSCGPIAATAHGAQQLVRLRRSNARSCWGAPELAFPDR
jgi:3-oxoacyl-[acyl-carrier-protein] synthase-1